MGSAANGLCGGMVFAALDHFTAGRPIPSVDRPEAGTPLYEFIASRLIDSFDLPTGPLKYLDYMSPGRRDRVGDRARLVLRMGAGALGGVSG